jgi:hypothetical protein
MVEHLNMDEVELRKIIRPPPSLKLRRAEGRECDLADIAEIRR